MPTSKSSTSINSLHRILLQQMAKDGDYKAMLNELLAVVHRDGGQYTALCGHATAVEDAMSIFYDLRRDLEELRREKSR